MERKNVCVITGGASGMGLATAKIIGKDHYIIISSRTVSKMENAIAELKLEGIEVESFACDVGDRDSVDKLVARANEVGKITAVIHAAGLSPHMGDAEKIMRANALGTINVNNAFSEVMSEGSCILNVSSMSAYMMPPEAIPSALYPLSNGEPEEFIKQIMGVIKRVPENAQPGMAYGISKNFVIWRAKQDAGRFGEKGIRVVSVSPGNFETPMGKLESVDGSKFIQYCAIKRFGRPEEIAFLFSTIVDERNGYLTATDISCDGGLVGYGLDKMRKPV